MSHPSPDPDINGTLVDPEHDATASYALHQSDVRRLTARVAATTGRTVATRSPINDQPLGHVPQSSVEDVAEAFGRARAAQVGWRTMPIEHRAERLSAYHDLILDTQEELTDLIVRESGKARKDAFDEVAHLALTARYYARTAARHLAPERRLGALPGFTRADVGHVPKGVVGVISPWNYPLTMAMCDGLAAVAAGCSVVAKPDSQTMLTALRAAELLEEAGVPKEVWQVVAGPGPEIGTAIVDHADYVCFTGSTATGRAIAHGCAERLIGCSLELGGKNPMLILRDADLERAAEGAVRASFANAGQLCVSMERIFVADQLYDRFVERFVARTEAMSLGATLDWDNDMGTLISAEQLERVQAHVDDAVAHGAVVRSGGRARPDLAPHFYEPTILEGVTPQMACFGGETFGPVVAVYRFHDEAEAISRANDGDFGLNAAIFSRDTVRARSMAAEIRCGTVNINEGFGATFASLDTPMGGMRSSGLGRRQGAEGILRFTEAQSVATQRLLRIAPMFGMGNRRHAAFMTANLRLLKRLGRP